MKTNNEQKQINAALKRCRAAFAKYPDAKWAWFCHHEVIAEPLLEPAETRIQYILEDKPRNELIVRFNNFRPVRDENKFAPAWAEHERVTAQALAEYRRVTLPALAEYERVKAPAWAEYERVTAQAWAEHLRVTAQAWAEYRRVTAPALAEYRRVTAPAWAEYKRVKAPALAEYERVKAPAFKAHLSKIYNQDVPLGTWNGKSIFA